MSAAAAVLGPFETLLVEEHETALVVRLNRPEQRNAITQAMVEELHVVCATLETAPRTLILTGQRPSAEGGKGCFAGGADIAELRSRRRHDALDGINSTLFTRIAALPMPVIAAIDGPALGGGAELALAADLRIATPGTRFGNPEVALGIIAAAGACWRLRELVGEQLAFEILILSRILTGQEMFETRIAVSLVEPENLLTAALEAAATIAENDPLAVRLTKSVLRAPRSAHPVIDNIAQAVTFESQAKFDRMEAFLTKRGARR